MILENGLLISPGITIESNVGSNINSTVIQLASVGSSTWTVPTGVSSIIVECYGGGGGGSSLNQRQNDQIGYGPGAGGGGGGYAKSVIISVTPGQSFPITIGAGGTAAAPNVLGANGVAGGTTTFNNTWLIANGGGGGIGPIFTPSTDSVGGSPGNASGTYADVIHIGGAGGSGGTGQTQLTMMGASGGGAGGPTSNGTTGGAGSVYNPTQQGGAVWYFYGSDAPGGGGLAGAGGANKAGYNYGGGGAGQAYGTQSNIYDGSPGGAYRGAPGLIVITCY
jgi:hypothetical protein